jgi:hypothetical protein
MVVMIFPRPPISNQPRPLAGRRAEPDRPRGSARRSWRRPWSGTEASYSERVWIDLHVTPGHRRWGQAEVFPPVRAAQAVLHLSVPRRGMATRASGSAATCDGARRGRSRVRPLGFVVHQVSACVGDRAPASGTDGTRQAGEGRAYEGNRSRSAAYSSVIISILVARIDDRIASAQERFAPARWNDLALPDAAACCRMFSKGRAACPMVLSKPMSGLRADAGGLVS